MLSGNTYTPTVLTGNGAGTLSAAVAAANSDLGTSPDTIMLGAGTYLMNLELDITSTNHTLIIDGNGTTGPGATVINQIALDRVFQVEAGVTVVFENLTIEGGTATTDSAGTNATAEGGGLLNLGTATLNNVNLYNNAALGVVPGEGASGGGIYNAGTLTIEQTAPGPYVSQIYKNSATAAAGLAGADGGAGGNANGAGIYSDSADPVRITNTNVQGNTAQAGAGGNSTAAVGGTGGNADGAGVELIALTGAVVVADWRYVPIQQRPGRLRRNRWRWLQRRKWRQFLRRRRDGQRRRGHCACRHHQQQHLARGCGRSGRSWRSDGNWR